MKLNDLLAKEAFSLVRSGTRGILKSLIKEKYQSFKTLSPAEIEKQIRSDLGYLTTHYTVSKDQKINYQPSAVFLLEWLQNSLQPQELLRDEETNKIYYQNHPITNQDKLTLVQQFSQQTSNKSTRIMGYLNAALHLLDSKDFTALSFAKEVGQDWKPGNPSLIDNCLPQVFGDQFSDSPETTEWAQFLFRKWIIGAATRIINPGASHDGCLVLQGPSGKGKTLFFRNLLPEPFNHRTGEVYADIRSSQKFTEALIGKSIINFDELSCLEMPKTEEIFKQLLSSQFIDVRLPYRRDSQRFLLRAAWGATTNKKKFITDSFVSRRLWIVKISENAQFNLEWLLEHRKLLWSEALYYAQLSTEYHLSSAVQKNLENYNKAYLI